MQERLRLTEENLSEHLAAAQKQEEELQSQLVAAQKEKETLADQSEMQVAKIKSLTNEVDEVNGALASEKSKVELYNKSTVTTQQSAERYLSETVSLKAQVEASAADLVTLRAKQEPLRAEVKEHGRCTALITELKEEIVGLRKVVSAKEVDLDAAKETVAGISSKQEGLRSKNYDLQQAVQTKTTAVAELTLKVEQADKQLEEAEKERNSLWSDVHYLNEKITEGNKLNKGLKTQLTALQARETLLYEVSSALNLRPLKPQEMTDHTVVVLTPEMLLTGKFKGCQQPPGDFQPREAFGTRRWRQVQALASQFWKKWSDTQAPELQSRSKWEKQRSDIKEGTVVLVEDPDAPRGDWRLGKVIGINVKMGSPTCGENRADVLERPIHKLVEIVAPKAN